jgi:hypothetical protein
MTEDDGSRRSSWQPLENKSNTSNLLSKRLYLEQLPFHSLEQADLHRIGNLNPEFEPESMMKPCILFTLLLAVPSAIHALQPASSKQAQQQITSRRHAFQYVLTGAASFAFAGNSANALDMDAFIQTEVRTDKLDT